MITFFNITGAMVYVDGEGRLVGYEDVYTKIDMCRAHYEANGLGADYVEQFIRYRIRETGAGSSMTDIDGRPAEHGTDLSRVAGFRLEWVASFVAGARHGSFSAAAAVLGRSNLASA